MLQRLKDIPQGICFHHNVTDLIRNKIDGVAIGNTVYVLTKVMPFIAAMGVNELTV
ncbi:MAG: hypothetical protein ACK5L0_01715 [Candidatus Fimivivens sp.]